MSNLPRRVSATVDQEIADRADLEQRQRDAIMRLEDKRSMEQRRAKKPTLTPCMSLSYTSRSL